MTTDMPRLAAPLVAVLAVTGLAWGVPAAAQTVAGRVTDQTGGVLPGVSVGLVTAAGEQTAVTDASGDFRFDHVEPGAAELTYRLINFTVLRRSLVVGDRELTPASAVLTLALSADVVVKGGAHVPQRRRNRTAGGESRRHRGLEQPGCDHRRPA